jgi:peptidoglycan/xylan/chitin deacetylase (PgdA/CDA1 family)
MQGRSPLILGYHGIGEVDSRHDPYQLYVGPEAFASQVRLLQGKGYDFVTMSEFADRQREQGEPPRGTVALTFDDGTSDHASVVPGLLDELGVPGTIYVCPGLSGQPYPWAPDAGKTFMTEAQLIELAKHPRVEIGSHTNEHYELDDADEETALAQMAGCKKRLEELLGIEVVSFCYPRCHFSDAAARMAPKAGYKSAVTCGMRGSWDPYRLKREVVHTRDGSLVFRMKTRGSFSGMGPGLPAKVLRRSALGLEKLLRMAPGGAGGAAPALIALIPS